MVKGALLVCKKEFLELSKDRRTLLYTFLLPLLLYPLIFLVVAGLGRRDARARLGRPSRIVIVDPAQALEPHLRRNPKAFSRSADPMADPRQALREQALDLYIEVDPAADAKLRRQETYSVKVLVDETEPASELALDRLREAMTDLDRERVAQRLVALNAPPELTRPSRIVTEDVAVPGLEAGKALGSFLPYIVMLMMFQGSMQHGIYVTAGEKERGTLQSLLATGLPRRQIIWGKLVFIFCMGLVAAVLNLISMGISLGVVVGRLAQGQAGQGMDLAGSLPALASPATLLISFLLLVPLGLLFTSFILFMGIRARNTAEAGTSLMPGLFLILMLGAVSLAPGIERIPLLPYVPILNVSLAIRKLFSQQGSTFETLLAFGMTLGFAMLMTWASTRLLDRESAIFRQS